MPGGPDHRAGPDRAGRRLDTVLVDIRDRHPESEVDADGAQLPCRLDPQPLGVVAEDPVGPLEQDDLGVVGIDGTELLGERLERDLGDRAGRLHARGAATHHDEGEVARAVVRVGRPFGTLEGEQYPPPDLERVLDGLEPGGVGFPVVVTEVRVGRPRGEDEILVGQVGAVVERDQPGIGIDADHLGEQHPHVRLAGEDRPDRTGDVRRVQSRRRHLVQQRLEQVMVAPVDHGQVDIRSGQPFRCGEPAESTADDQHAWAGHGGNVATARRSTVGSRADRIPTRDADRLARRYVDAFLHGPARFR